VIGGILGCIAEHIVDKNLKMIIFAIDIYFLQYDLINIGTKNQEYINGSLY